MHIRKKYRSSYSGRSGSCDHNCRREKTHEKTATDFHIHRAVCNVSSTRLRVGVDAEYNKRRSTPDHHNAMLLFRLLGYYGYILLRNHIYQGALMTVIHDPRPVVRGPKPARRVCATNFSVCHMCATLKQRFWHTLFGSHINSLR